MTGPNGTRARRRTAACIPARPRCCTCLLGAVNLRLDQQQDPIRCEPLGHPVTQPIHHSAPLGATAATPCSSVAWQRGGQRRNLRRIGQDEAEPAVGHRGDEIPRRTITPARCRRLFSHVVATSCLERSPRSPTPPRPETPRAKPPQNHTRHPEHADSRQDHPVAEPRSTSRCRSEPGTPREGTTTTSQTRHCEQLRSWSQSPGATWWLEVAKELVPFGVGGSAVFLAGAAGSGGR